ncbi:MAG TPA: dihydroorotase, partial [Sedimenticola sp.]|nr:dihydroorotase [Sedimenticola sp.]
MKRTERILITGGRLIDPASGVDGGLALALEDGRVCGVGELPPGFRPERLIDATGCVVCPGLIDLSARPREPGMEHKATIASETRAAAASGITTLCCPPDTSPVIDTAAMVTLVRQRAQEAGHARVLPQGALTQGLGGDQLSEMAALLAAGCVAFGNGGLPLGNTLIERRALEYAA